MLRVRRLVVVDGTKPSAADPAGCTARPEPGTVPAPERPVAVPWVTHTQKESARVQIIFRICGSIWARAQTAQASVDIHRQASVTSVAVDQEAGCFCLAGDPDLECPVTVRAGQNAIPYWYDYSRIRHFLQSLPKDNILTKAEKSTKSQRFLLALTPRFLISGGLAARYFI